MPNTVAQLQALAESGSFQGRVRGAIFQKAVAIVDDARVNNTANYTAPQIALAKNLCLGTINTGSYFSALAGSANVAASNVTYDFITRQVVTDISDADLNAEVFTVVFQDLL